MRVSSRDRMACDKFESLRLAARPCLRDDGETYD
jgi:hypothetical protein